MKLVVKKLNDNATIPTYGSEEASGFDLYSSSDVIIKPQEKILVPTGISLDIPKGYEVQVRPRSGLSLKTPIHICNSPGTIDSDYTGEVYVIVQNLASIKIDKEKNLSYPEDIVIKKGVKIAQGILAPVLRAEILEGEIKKETERGSKGFGSTDNKAKD